MDDTIKTNGAPKPAKQNTQEITITTSTGAEYIDKHTTLFAKVFSTDPGINYMLGSLTPEKREAYRPKYMRILLRGAMLNAGVFQQADDWSCAAVWMLPGKRVDNELTIIQAGFFGVVWTLGLEGAKKMLGEYSGQAERIKKEFLVDLKTGERIKRYHYLWFIGTAVEARGRGLASRVIRKRQEAVKEDGLPIWLEATTAQSRDVYAKCGFQTVGEIRLGAGTHADTGFPEKDGKGVTVYAMLWRPEWHGEGKRKDGEAKAGSDTAGAAAS